MKERPILFSSAMVRALLAGTKTQTRRRIKLQTGDTFDEKACVGAIQERRPVFDKISGGLVGTESVVIRCPYGVPGDRLWVRETLRRENHAWTYAADGAAVPWPARATIAGLKRESIPSIHMRRDAARLTLEITNVRIERLNDCSEADALAEGVCWSDQWQAFVVPGVEHPNKDFPVLSRATAREMYAALWDTINGSGEWLANPWVWAVSFKRVTP